MHAEAFGYVRAKAGDLHLGGAMLDLGGRDVNGTVHGLFPDATWTVVDIADHPSVDHVGDAATIDLGRTFDVVVSTECFEHTPDSCRIIANAYKHLRPGGVLVATMAGPGRAPHGASGEPTPPAGEYYSNVTPDDLFDWLKAAGFEDIVLDQTSVDLRCTARRPN